MSFSFSDLQVNKHETLPSFGAGDKVKLGGVREGL